MNASQSIISIDRSSITDNGILLLKQKGALIEVESKDWAFKKLCDNVNKHLVLLENINKTMVTMTELHEELYAALAYDHLEKSIASCNRNLAHEAAVLLKQLVPEECHIKGNVKVDGYLDAPLQPLLTALNATEVKWHALHHKLSDDMRNLRSVIRDHCELEPQKAIKAQPLKRQKCVPEAAPTVTVGPSDDEWVQGLGPGLQVESNPLPVSVDDSESSESDSGDE
jgi:hypothetical protein